MYYNFSGNTKKLSFQYYHFLFKTWEHWEVSKLCPSCFARLVSNTLPRAGLPTIMPLLKRWQVIIPESRNIPPTAGLHGHRHSVSQRWGLPRPPKIQAINHTLFTHNLLSVLSGIFPFDTTNELLVQGKPGQFHSKNVNVKSELANGNYLTLYERERK